MPVWVRRSGEGKDSGGGDSDADAVGDNRAVGDVARVGVAAVLGGDRVAHAVAEVDAGVAEADARERGREEHLRLGGVVVRVAHRAREVFDCLAQGLQAEDVGDGVRALIGWAVDGVLGPRRPGGVGDCGPGF